MPRQKRLPAPEKQTELQAPERKYHSYSGKSLGTSDYKAVSTDFYSKTNKIAEEVAKTVAVAKENTKSKKEGGFWKGIYNFMTNDFVEFEKTAFKNNLAFGTNILGTTAMMTGSAAEFLAEPVEGISIPDKVNWLEVATLADELLAFFPNQYTGQAPSIRKAMGYVPDMTAAEKTRRQINGSFQALFGDIEDDQTRNEFYNEYMQSLNNVQQAGIENFQNQRALIKDPVTQMPLLTPVKQWWDGMADGQPSWFLSKTLNKFNEGAKHVVEDYGQVSTGNDAADYMINGTSSLVGSIIGSVIPGTALAKGVGIGSKALQARGMITASKAVESVGQVGIAVALTGSESLQVAKDTYDNVVQSRLREAIGAENYDNAYAEFMTKQAGERADLDGEINPEDNPMEYNRMVSQTDRAFKEKMVKENQHLMPEIRKAALEAHRTTVTVNTANILLNTLSARMYLRGRTPTRNLLKQPKKTGFTVGETWRAGHNEGLEEVVNQIAQDAGEAQGTGEQYGVSNVFRDALSGNHFESYAWGFAGGMGEAMVTNWNTYKERRKQFEAQQKVVLAQDRIGSATPKTINDIVSIGNTFQQVKEKTAAIEKLRAEGKNQEADTIAEQILPLLTINAFKTGTTENLIRNFQTVADNEQFNDETRKAAKEAIGQIQIYEESYIKALKYNNAEDVFMNEISQELLEQQIQIARKDFISSYNKILGERLAVDGKDAVKQVKEVTTDLTPELKEQFDYLNTLEGQLGSLAQDNVRLKSKQSQADVIQQDNFRNEWAKTQLKLRKDYKKKNKNPLGFFNTTEYKNAFDNLIKKYEGKISEGALETIKRNDQSERVAAKIATKMGEENVINNNATIHQKLANHQGLSKDTAPAADVKGANELNTVVNSVIIDEFDEGSFDPKRIDDNQLTDDQKSSLRGFVQQMYGTLKNTIENPTIEDVVRYYMTLTSAKQAENNLDAIVKGWKYAQLPQAENITTDDLFKSMFQANTIDLINEFNELVNELPTDLSPQEQVEFDKKAREAEERTLNVQNKETSGVDANGSIIVNPSDKLDTPSATLAHKSNAVVEEYDEQGNVITLTHKKINDLPNMSQSAPHQNKILFHDQIRVGTSLNVEVDENFMDTPVKVYDVNGQPTTTIKFSEWLEARNAELKKEGKPELTPDSQEYIDKVPMVVKDSDGDVIALIHDVSRISLFHNTKSSVDQAKANTRKIRNAAIKGQGKVIVTNKSIGHILPYLETPVKLKDADPTATLAIGVAGGKLEFQRQDSGIDAGMEHEQIIYSEGHPRKGELYELRRVGNTENGKPKFFALKANRPTSMNADVQQGVFELVQAFINKDKNREQFEHITKMISNWTKGEIDMRSDAPNNMLAIDNYLSMFMHVARGSSVTGSLEHKINTTIEGIVNRKKAGSAPSYFIFTIQGKVVIGEAHAGNAELSKSMVKIGQLAGSDAVMNNQNNEFLAYLKDFVLPNIRPDVSKARLNSSVPVPILKDGKLQSAGKNYNDYLRNTFETTNPARQVTENFGDGQVTTYVSFIQPNVEVRLEGEELIDEAYFAQMQSGELSDNIADQIADKINRGELLTAQEEQLMALNPDKVNALVKSRPVTDEIMIEYNGRQIPLSEYEKIIDQENSANSGMEFYLDDDSSLDPRKMTDQEQKRISEAQHTIQGIIENDYKHIVEYIFNNVARFAKIQKGKVVNIDEIKAEIRRAFDAHTDAELARTEKRYSDSLDAYNILINHIVGNNTDPAVLKKAEETHAKYKRNYMLLGERLNKLKIIKDNWEKFEIDALNMSKKYLAIDNSKAVATMPDAEEESMEERVEQEDSHTPQFDKTSEEINHKERVSADVRVFCQGIEMRDNKGNKIMGTFGTPKYVGFDTIFDTISALLADQPANTSSLLDNLKKNQDAHNWIPDFIEKFEKADKSLQNEIVRHMTKHAIDMEFVMFSKGRDGSYQLKVYSANSTAIVRSLKTQWQNNIFRQQGESDSGIITVDNEGNYIFNNPGIKRVLREFTELKGEESPKVLPAQFVKDVIRNIFDAKIATETQSKTFDEFINKFKNNGIVRAILPHAEIARFTKLRDELLSSDSNAKVIFTYKAKRFTVTQDGNSNELVFKLYEQEKPKLEKVKSWLMNFGIEISDQTAFEILYDGFRYDKNKNITFDQQWEGEDSGKGNSLFGVLAGTLRKISQKLDADSDIDLLYDENGLDITDTYAKENEEINKGREEHGYKLLSQTIINSLAVMESRHTEHRIVQSFYDNNKVLYGFTATKYITDRVNEIKRKDEDVLNNLRSTSYNKHSFWLDMLESDENFAHNFKVVHLAKTALKERGKKMYRDNAYQNLSLIDHELVKLGFFMQMGQGLVKHNKTKYAGLDFRMAEMFSPTMSDKSTATIIKTAILNYNSTLDNNFDNVLSFLYDQLIMPDLTRISNFTKLDDKNRVNSYAKGASLFYTIPKLNELEVPFEGQMISLTTLAEKKGASYINSNPEIKNKILKALTEVIDSEQNKKLNQWQDGKFITKDETGQYTEYKFLDRAYMNSKSRGTIDSKVRLAAKDYVINSLLASANSMMVIAGDPAQYYKGTGNDTMQDVKDTFMNIGKRLANQIAPGDKLADSDMKNNTYLQLMMNDVFTISDNIKMITKLLDGKEISDAEIASIQKTLELHGPTPVKREFEKKYPNSIDYMNIESTNAQEYTTWKEHLYVLEKMGKSTDASINVTQEDIDEARKIFTNETKWENLTDTQKVIVNKIVQPMKPVYTGQIKDEGSDLMRTVYIKTSSFPLIPQLTGGMEIDKLRQAMEDIEKKSGKNVRASFSSGNKVGAIGSPLNIVGEDGTIDGYQLLSPNDLINNYTLELPRSGFRIQQNVPFKSALTDEDIVTLGTQTMKLLFGNGVISMTDFDYNGNKVHGSDLYNYYNNLFGDMITQARNNLFKEIGVNPLTGNLAEGVTLTAVNKKLSKILQNEAITRGFPPQDIEALGIDPSTGEFNLPLWLSPNANKYEALLTAIVSHRIAKIKFPGYSYVLGSENGFKIRTDEEFDIKKNGNRIVFTDAWTGKLKPHQAFIQSKFRVDGKLIDLINDGYAKEVDGKWVLDTEKIDASLLNLPSFRIPTSKHSSMESIEIAGFLPSNSADLMIVSQDGTVSIGEDYDVDKRFTYQLWTTVEKGKIIPLDQKKEYKNKDYIDSRMAKLELDIQALREASRSYIHLQESIQRSYDSMDILVKENDTNQKYLRRINEFEVQFGQLEDGEIELMIQKAIDEFQQLKKDKLKLVQNEIIKIHNSVLQHPTVNKMMVEKLSIDDATADAEFLESLNDQDDENFTPFSDMYQQRKVMSGAVGKLGTASYSLDVVGQSLFEQAHMTGNTLQLMTRDEENPKVIKPYRLKIGHVQSNGKLGQQLSYSVNDGFSVKQNGRPVADVHSERQNLMVDNEKEQIAIRVHLNNYTMKVDKVLNMLGFDKGEKVVMENGIARDAKPDEQGTKHSISFLFISQPIVKEFVQMMEAENSNTAEYNPNRKEDVLLALYEKYGATDVDNLNMDDEMTSVNLINNIINGGKDNLLQAAVLKKFMELSDYGDYITSVQTSINTDSKGVGKNLFETQEKITSLLKLFGVTTDKKGTKSSLDEGKMGMVANAGSLVGNYHMALSKEEMSRRLEDGYVLIKKDVLDDENKAMPVTVYHMIKPSTVVGAYTVNALTTAESLWGRFFPYNESTVAAVFDEIRTLVGNSDLSEAKAVEIKKLIFNEMKKYLVTDQDIDYFDMTPQQERIRLFFDSIKGKGTKQSLASFLKNQMGKNNKAGELLRANKLINRLTFEVNNNGKPSLIKLDNAIGQNFDENYIYSALGELIDLNLKLDEFDGKPYTTLNLAQDLVLYAYMEGGVQQAIQFIKYIPVSYIKILGIDKLWKKGTRDFNQKNLLGVNLNTKEDISVFSKQFMQHHPELAKRITPEIMSKADSFQILEQFKEGDLSALSKFAYTTVEGTKPAYVSLYNENLPKNESKFQLYVLTKENDKDIYVRVPVYGQFGMSEYSAQATGYTSLINQQHFPYPKHRGNVIANNDIEGDLTENIEKFDLANGNVKNSLNIISEQDSSIGRAAKFLLQAIGDNVRLQIAPLKGARGRYKDGMITISSDFFNNPNITEDELATTFVRESVHAVVNNMINKYITGFDIQGNFTIKETAPVYVKKLYALFKEVQKELNKNGELDALMQKVDKLRAKDPNAEGLTEEEYNVTYAGYDIYEFVERMMTSPDLQRRMNETPFRNSNKSLLEKFYEFIDSVLTQLAKDLGLQELKKENITAQSFDAIYALINEKIESDTKVQEMITRNNEMLKLEMTEQEYDKAKEAREKQEGTDFDSLLDADGYIDDNPFSDDPLIIRNFESLKAVTAKMILEGKLKYKCDG